MSRRPSVGSSPANGARNRKRVCVGASWSEAVEGFEGAGLLERRGNKHASGPEPRQGRGAEERRYTPAAYGPAANAVARSIVCVLLRQPLPGFSPYLARRAGPGSPGDPPGLAQLDQPLTYTEVADRFVWNGYLEPDLGGRRPQPPKPALGFGVRGRGGARDRYGEPSGAPRSHAQPWHGQALNPYLPERALKRRRPGRGGHQPRSSSLTSTSATRELLANIGPPDVDERRHGIGFMYWNLEGTGTALGLARLSSEEIQNGEGVLQQVHAIRHLVSRTPGLELGHLVVTTDNSGGRSFETRPDLMLLDSLIADGEVDALVARDADRLIRCDSARATLEELLKASKTDLYLCSKGGKLDLYRDKLAWRIQGLIAEAERDIIVARTESGWVQSRLAEGQGRPGAVPFGFYWDPEFAEVRVDPEQWPWVIYIHEGYERLCQAGGGSLRELERELADKCPLSRTHLRNMLKNPIYVTGEYTVRWRGMRVTTKPIKLDRPIPLDLFQRNQERLALNRGPSSTTPIGYFALNNIPVMHGACMDQLVASVRKTRRGPADVQPLLRGRGMPGPGHPAVYGHFPRTPTSCARYTLAQDAIEPVVMRELLHLARSRELQEQWRRAPRGRPAPKVRMLTKERRAAIVQELKELERRRFTLEERWVDSTTPEARMDPDAYLALVRPLNHAIKRLERQLELDGKLAKPREPTPVGAPLRNVAAAVDLDDDAVYAELLERLEVVLTEMPPDDPELMRQRAAVVAASLSSLVVRDVPEGFTVELRGPLVPPEWRSNGAIGPIASAHQIIAPARPKPVRSRARTHEESMLEPSTTRSSSGRFEDGLPLLVFGDVSSVCYDQSNDWIRKKPAPSAVAPGSDWEPQWISPPVPFTSAWAPSRGHSPIVLATAAIRRAWRLLGCDIAVTPAAYDDLRRTEPGASHLPPLVFFDRLQRQSGVTWEDVLRRALPEPHEARRLSFFVTDDLSYNQLSSGITTGRLKASRRGRLWFTTEADVDEFLRTRVDASSPDGAPGPKREDADRSDQVSVPDAVGDDHAGEADA